MKKKRFCAMILAIGFVLGVHDGCIALWREGASTPLRVFPYRVEMLPEKDQKALQRGIVISDRNALSSILEDYLS